MTKRKRTERRRGELAARKLVRGRERLARLEPGGSRERPIEVVSSSVIAIRGRSQPCPQCAGSLRIVEERAESATLRELEVECQSCGVRRVLWFRITTPLPN